MQVVCRVLKRAEEFDENTVPEQDKQECTQKTAGEHAIQGSGDGRVGCASMTLELVCRAEVLGVDEEGVFIPTLSWQPKPQPPVCAMRRPSTTCQRQP